MRILLTAFEPLDDGLNASKELVHSLHENPPPLNRNFAKIVRCRVMSGDTHKTKNELLEAIAEFDPDCCVCIGQAPGRNKITLERFAQNLKDFGSPDAAGNRINGLKIEEDGPAAYWQTLPDLEGMMHALNTSGIPAAASNHAGNHLCNQILYHALHYAACTGHRLKAGFVHIPPLPVQAQTQWLQTPFMSLEMLRNGLAVILNRLITQG